LIPSNRDTTGLTPSTVFPWRVEWRSTFTNHDLCSEEHFTTPTCVSKNNGYIYGPQRLWDTVL